MSGQTELDPTAEVVQHVMSLTEDEFRSFVAALNTAEVPTSQVVLTELMSAALPSGNDGEQLTAFSLAFAATLYWGSYDSDATLKRIARSTASQIDRDPSDIEGRLRSLLLSRAVLLVSGAQSGRRKTAGLIERFAVNMDVRPVVHPERSEVELYAIYHRMHLVVTDDESGQEEKVIEIVLDHDDLDSLRTMITASLDAEQRVQATLKATGAAVYMPMKGD